jgi:class 3 adenylate cyclase/tetratricopeptide (TPR) repeat protein
MRCSKCETNNPSTNNFCAKCGNALAKHCPKCKSENPANAAFCGKCGTALTTASASSSSPGSASDVRLAAESNIPDTIEGERKTVTALFADIKGSMELIEDLDPEEARAIVDPALKLMIDAAHRYGGYIVQSTGDGIFALFGAPVAHEDHPQRALYSALRMQEDLKTYADKLREQGQPPLSVRVGVNSGEVVVRSIQTAEGHTEYTPIGHSIGLASRLQTLAAPGSVVIGESVRKFVEGYFELNPLGASRIKGASEPVHIFEVSGYGPLRTRLQRAAGRGYTKFVGRRREIDAMKAAAEQALAGHGQIVAAIAEPGVGKSRLFHEFKATSQSGWMVLEAFSVSYGKATAYLPLIDLLHSYFDISPDDDARKRREKVAGRLAILDPSLESTRPYLFSLLGIVEGDEHGRRHWEQRLDRLDEYLHELQKKDPLAQMDAQVRKRRTLDAIKRILIRESLNQPLIVIFEDLHWIDDETQSLLNLLADSIGTARILLLVNYRPEYSHQWNSKTYYTQLRLDPLGKESADEMLSSLLGDDKDLIPLKRLIIEKTEGNPFFMEEVVQRLFEDGALTRNGTVRLVSQLGELKIPPTVQGILAARIDKLPRAEKDLLQTLAVIGKEFQQSLVRAVTGTPEDQLQPMLDDLQLAEFIYEQPAAGDVEYTFKHALTQQVASQSVLIDRRKALHERTAVAIETLHADHVDDRLAELAYHYSRSANLPKAIDYLGRAANQASQRSLYAEAIDYVNRGLELLAAMPDSDARAGDELKLQMLLGTALMAARGFGSEEVERAFSRVCELARRLNDPANLFRALQGVWGFHYSRADVDSALKVANESMTLANESNDGGALMVAHYALGATFLQAGKNIRAREYLESAVALKNEAVPMELGPDPRVLSLTCLSDLLFIIGYPDQSLQRSYEAMQLVERESDPFSYAMALLFVIQAHCARRETDKAAQLCPDMIELCTEHGFPYWLAVANRLTAWTTILQGRYREGLAMVSRQIDGPVDDNDDSTLSRLNLLPFVAEAYGNLGEFDRGFEALEQWLGMRSTYSVTGMDKLYCRLRGEILLKAGSAEEAEESLRRAIQLSASESAKMEQLRATTTLARLLQTQGRRDEARTMLAEIYNWFTEGFDIADLKDAKALLDQLGG